MIICIHHNDADGYASAAVVCKKYSTGSNIIKFFKMDYNLPLPLSEIHSGDTVVIVDFSPANVQEFNDLLSITNDVIWIDHHKTAIDKFDGFKHIKGIRKIGTAACELCWEYLFPQVNKPRAIELIGDYDVWKFQYGENTKHFHAAIMMEDISPKDDILWGVLLDDNLSIQAFINQGMLITKINAMNWKRMIMGIGYKTEIDGVSFIACNLSGPSLAFDSLKPDITNGFITYTHNGKQFKVTLYSCDNKVTDVSVIAKKYGGGGHTGAAGFFCDELPFDFVEKLCQDDFKE